MLNLTICSLKYVYTMNIITLLERW